MKVFRPTGLIGLAVAGAASLASAAAEIPLDVNVNINLDVDVNFDSSVEADIPSATLESLHHLFPPIPGLVNIQGRDLALGQDGNRTIISFPNSTMPFVELMISDIVKGIFQSREAKQMIGQTVASLVPSILQTKQISVNRNTGGF